MQESKGKILRPCNNNRGHTCISTAKFEFSSGSDVFPENIFKIFHSSGKFRIITYSASLSNLILNKYSPLLVVSRNDLASCREALTPSRTSGVRTPTGIRTPTGVRTPTGLHTPTGIGDESESGAPRLSRVDLDKLFMDPSRWASIKLGINMPARVEKTVRKRDFEAQLIGEPTGQTVAMHVHTHSLLEMGALKCRLKVTVLTIYLATGNELSQPPGIGVDNPECISPLTIISANLVTYDIILGKANYPSPVATKLTKDTGVYLGSKGLDGKHIMSVNVELDRTSKKG
ncbi:hypothetical protein POTOM_014544 [Populus tomentosa]|uniref:Uncharacterized protein n=1 Tax=Populus tomentosa TaxID=118781 RepID=A0A8X8A260_POPTO|nr:hypothetical protein POTOM_014544 [Populus tomentosa]